MSSISDLNASGQVVLAAVANVATNAVVHPICTLKNRSMAHQPLFSQSQGIFKGVKMLYAGYLSGCATESVCCAISYVVNDFLKKQQLSPLTSSIVAGIASAPAVTLGEAVMVNAQVHNTSMMQAIKTGFTPSGFTATLCREVPFTVALFAWAPWIQGHMSFSHELTNQIAGGSLSGAVCGVLTAPVDKIKTIVQTENLSLVNATCLTMKELSTSAGRQAMGEACMFRASYIAIAVAVLNLLNNQLPPRFPEALKTQ